MKRPRIFEWWRAGVRVDDAILIISSQGQDQCITTDQKNIWYLYAKDIRFFRRSDQSLHVMGSETSERNDFLDYQVYERYISRKDRRWKMLSIRCKEK